jgi:lipoprotein
MMDKIRKIRIITVITTVFSCIMLGLGAVMGSISAYIFTQMNQVPSFDTIGMDSNGKLNMSPFTNISSTSMFNLVCVSLIGVGIGIVIINIIPCITGIQTYNMIKYDGISEHECMELSRRDGFFKFMATIVPIIMLVILYFILRIWYFYFFIAYCILVIPMLLALYQIYLCRE